MRNRRAFTLVELLVVVGVIAILIAMLLPALGKARRTAKNVECSSAMRQSLMGVLIYNTQYPKTGLTNWSPRCQFWGQDWNDGVFGPWPAAVHWNTWADASTAWLAHCPDEGRSGASYWRGYLLEARVMGNLNSAGAVMSASGLGCTFQNYSDMNLWGWGSNGGWSSVWGANHIETSSQAATLKQFPAFIWYGPGAASHQQVSAYTGGNLIVPNNPPIVTRGFYSKRRVLMTCPLIFLRASPTSVKMYQYSHRIDWGQSAVGSYIPYAMNVGFTDGSVRYVESFKGGSVDPNRL